MVDTKGTDAHGEFRMPSMWQGSEDVIDTEEAGACGEEATECEPGL